jgi:hypothetical protein
LQFNTTAGSWAYNTPPYDSQTPGGYPPSPWGPNWTGYPHIADARIKTFVCPSDNAQDLTVGEQRWMFPGMVFDNLISLGQGWYADTVWDWPNFGHEMGAANYIGCAGYAGMGPNRPDLAGPYYANSKTRIESIGDGTSNTIAFGETLGGVGGKPTNRVSRLSWMGAGSLMTMYGLPNEGAPYTFGSRHSGVVMFGFCDGTVRPIRTGFSYPQDNFNNAVYANFIYASGANDGQVIDSSLLGQ